MRRLLKNFACVALCLCMSAAAALAQSTAQLDGRVTDESQGVLPGATVTVTQTDTGLTRTVVTDADGGYVLPNIPTGPYRLEVSLPGLIGRAQVLSRVTSHSRW